MISCEFTCLCGKMKGWITDGETKKNHALLVADFTGENMTPRV